jgi:hypothetical protein
LLTSKINVLLNLLDLRSSFCFWLDAFS